jgi:hypothetical protein
VAALGCGELEPPDDAPGLGGVVAGDCGLESLSQRLWLAKLPAQPAEEADAGGVHGRQAHETSGSAHAAVRIAMPRIVATTPLPCVYAPIV